MSPTNDQPNLLFVHGAWHGSWCWDGWRTRASDRGFASEAVDLPGHDRPGDGRRIWNRIGQYVDAAEDAVRSLDGPTVVVGHSMGGFVTRFLLRRQVPNVVGGVLLGSVPYGGVIGATWAFLRANPANTLTALLTADLYRLVNTEEKCRFGFFTPRTPDAVVAATADRLQSESYLAFPPMLVCRPGPKEVDVPVLVIAAEEDALFPVQAERALAETYGARFDVVPGGHDIMLDEAEEAAFGIIAEWAGALPTRRADV